MIDIRTVLGNKPGIEDEILLCHCLKKNRAYLYTHPEAPINAEELANYRHLIAERARGVPIAYLTGEREFWSLKLKVNYHTLIPRHETELLIELALQHINEPGEIHLLDLGTGSGAIALALAKEKPHWKISACDRSTEALLIAQENARMHQIQNVQFYHSDWFSSIPQRQYHAIVANPPYIAEQDPHLQQGDLCFEPRDALVSNKEGLADLECIIKQGYDYLKPGGILLLEHGYDQKLSVASILTELSYKDARCWQDLEGHDRVSGGWK